MSESIFQAAYDRARGKYSDDAWFSLNPRQITEAIYLEIRQLDAERVGAAATESTPVAVRPVKSAKAPGRGQTRRATVPTVLA